MASDSRVRHLFAFAADTPVRSAPTEGGNGARESGVSRRPPLPDRETEIDLSGRPVRRCRSCHCVLSRYNDDPYCSGCARKAPRQPEPTPSVPAEVWRHAEVQEALIARDFGRMCQRVRVASGLRQSDMADLTGLSQAFLTMLESGTRRLTNIDKIVELLAGLNTPTELTGPILLPPKSVAESDQAAWHTRATE